MILINNLISETPLTLISWHSAPFLVFQVEEILFKLSIMNRSSPQLIIHVVYTLLSINSFNLLMNVSWRHIFCSLELYHCRLFHVYWRTLTLPFLQAKLTATSSRSLKFSPVVQGSVLNLMQYSVYSHFAVILEGFLYIFSSPFFTSTKWAILDSQVHHLHHDCISGLMSEGMCSAHLEGT